MSETFDHNPFKPPEQPTPTDKPTTGQPSFWPYILPFLAYMLISSRTPNVKPASIDDVAVMGYFVIVITQVIVSLALVLFFLKRYLNDFPFRIDVWGFVVGAIGVVLWIGICELALERNALALIGLGDWLPERIGFNPFAQITDPTRRTVFLIFRFALLAAMVPIIEELFLRGWLVRVVEDPDWYRVRLSDVGRYGIIAVAVYGLATHPGEAIAAIVWFTMVSILMVQTGKFWNCVVAHAVTNLLLGIYVVYFSQWQYW